jgi:hypothetical protein
MATHGSALAQSLTKHFINIIIGAAMTVHFPARRAEHRDRALALGAGLFLFAIYLLSYRGGFHSIDEVSMFAVTESLVKFGQLNTDQIAWTQWTTTQSEAQGFFGVDGHVYSKKGLAISLGMAPLYWIGLVTPGLGMLQTASLFNAIITATSGGLLYCLVRRLNYREPSGLGVAVLYGLATIAWVYAKYLFSEPLAGLLLLGTTYLLVAFRQEGGTWRAALAGMLAGLAVVTRANNLFLVPVFAAYLLITRWQQTKTTIPTLQSLISFGLGLVPPCLLLMGYNWARAGNPLQTGYDLTLFSSGVLLGLYKLLLSPLRGFLIYSPLLVLGIPGLVWLWRAHPAEAMLATGVTGITVLLFSIWSSGEGLSWGSRFLVPIVPFLCLALAPALQRAFDGSKLLAVLVVGLAVLSFAIQFLGVGMNPWIYLGQIQAQFGGEFFLENTPALTDFRYSQIIGQIQSWSLANSDIAWWQPGAFDPVALGLSLFLLAIAVANLTSQISMIRPQLSSLVTLTCTLLVTSFLLARYYMTDQRQFGPLDDPYSQALNIAAGQADPQDRIVTVAQNHYHVPMNRFKARVPIIGFARQSPPVPETALSLLRASLRGPTTWLITVGFSPAAPDNAVERWLTSNAFKAKDQWLDDARLVWYGTENQNRIHLVQIVLGQELRLVSASAAEAAISGQILPVEFRWLPIESPGADYNLFLQLLDGDGKLVAQHDGPPNGGYTLTSAWSPGQEIIDRHGLALPSDLPAGTYQLIAGLYDPNTGQRVPAQPEGDFVDLGTVRVE